MNGSKIELAAGILTVIGIGLFAFDDVAPLRDIGGGFLASPSWIFVLAAGGLVSRQALKRSDRPLLGILVSIWLYGAVLTSITLPFIPAQLLGESTFSKSAKLAVTVLVLLSVMIAGVLLIRVLRTWVAIGAILALLIMLLSGVLAHLGISGIDDWSLLHSYPNIQMRVRGTRFEPSALGGGILVAGSIAAVALRRWRGLLVLTLSVVGALFIAQSRGAAFVAAAVLALGVVLVIVRLRTKAELKSGPAWVLSTAVALLVLTAVLSAEVVLTSAWWETSGLGDAAGSTSDVTRSVWASAMVSSLWQYPFGMGYAAYLEWLPDLLREMLARSTLSPAELSEVQATISSATDETLSGKTLPTVVVTHLGVLGLLAALALYSFTIKAALRSLSHGDTVAALAATVAVLVSSTFLWSVFSWDQMFLFGVLAFGSTAIVDPPSLDLDRPEETRKPLR